MDPISAFSLVVNVLAVVDLSIKILSAASEVRSRGDTVTRSDRRLVSEDLLLCCGKLKAARTEETALPGDPASPTAGQVVIKNTLLESLADEAMIIATDIQRSLAKQKPGASVWKSLRHVIVATWGESKLLEKSERLEIIRSELQFHAIISIKTKVDLLALRESTQIKALDENTQKLIHAMSIDHRAMRQELDSRTESLNQKLEEARWHSNQQHQATTSLAIHHHRKQINAIRETSNQPEHMNKNTLVSKVVEKILNALWFSRMADRFDDIKPAYCQTFEWIYSDERDNDSSSCTFMRWIHGENGVFWVSGRAGSGKSTLMKFLAGDNRTRKAFKTWAGDRILITANYWFWSQAQDLLQKSLHGFLRALMYNIIQHYSDYAELLFPDQFIMGRDWTEFPTSHELKRAFRRLVEADIPSVCVALIIDGLDEFEAPEEEHFELARTLKDAARARHLKIVVSSRPETAFETTFMDCEKLRLHELTRADCSVYVTDHLYQHPRFNFLVNQARNGEKEKRKLVQYTIEGSEGIFLWLRLVVAALIDDLHTCSTLAELRAILDKFPRGLEKLYSHMLQRIPEERQMKGMQLVQLVRCAVAVSERKVSCHSSVAPPMSALMLSKAHSDYRHIIKRNWKPLHQTVHQDTVKRVDYLLRSHCAGLLELKYRVPEMGAAHQTQDGQTSSSLEDPEVAFLHKTVVEFLDRTDTKSGFLPAAINANRFNPYVSLMSCLLYKIKTHPLSDAYWPYKWSLVLRIMHTAVFAEIDDLDTTTRLLEGLDRAMEQTCIEIGGIPSNAEGKITTLVTHWSSACPKLQANWYPTQEHRDQELPRGDSMLSFAIENGLARFPLDKLSQLETCEQNVKAASLLVSACRATTLQSLMTGGIRPAVILQLLRLRADPNCCFKHKCARGRILATTPWIEMLHTIRQLRPTSMGGSNQLFEVLKAFLKSGADPEARIYYERDWGSSKSSFTTVKALIQQCFDRDPDHCRIPFIPFEEVWQVCCSLRRLPTTRHSHLYVPELLWSQPQILYYNSLSPSEIKQVVERKRFLIKMLERPWLLEQPVRRRRMIWIFHKLVCQCSGMREDSTDEDSEGI